MRACQGCGVELPPKKKSGPDRKWCSERCRRVTLYAGVCEECGGPTDGSNGRGKAPKVCSECLRWTREAIILALQEWAETHDGRAPRLLDARPGGEGHGRLPHLATAAMKSRFESWNEALVAAGLEVNMDRFSETTDEMAAAVRRGEALREVAARYGCTPENVRMRLKRRGMTVQSIRSASVRS